MKFLKATVALVLLVTISAYVGTGFNESPNGELEIGAKAPMIEHEVKDISGEKLTLKDVNKSNGLLVMFTCNTCPWVHKWEDRYNPISTLARENNVGMIALNPNTKYRDNGDGFEDMKKRAKDKNYQFSYALDKKNKLADAFGATRTPHIFLFNSNLELVYRGAIDDNAESAENVEQPYLKNAIKQLAAGDEISTKTTKSLGCTIKRVK